MTQKNNDSAALTLGADRLFEKIIRFCSEYRYSLLATLIFGLLSYTFVFTNKLMNPDELGNLLSLGFTVSSGRWGLELLQRMFPIYSMPWLNGIMTLGLIGLASCLIVNIFQIRRPVLQFLLSGLIIVFPSLIGTFLYMFTSTSYGLSFLMSVGGVYCLTRKISRKNWYLMPAGVLLFVLSLSIYQAYIALSAGLLVVYLIRETMYSGRTVGELFKKGLLYVALLIVSLSLYWVISQLFIRCSPAGMNNYASDALEAPRGLWERFHDTVVYFIMVFTEGLNGIFFKGLSQYLHIFCTAVAGVEVLFWCCHKKNLKRIPLLVFLFAMLPLAVTCLVLIVIFASVHTLSIYSFVSLYVLAFVILEENSRILSGKKVLDRIRSVLLNLVLISCSVIIAFNIFLANKTYLAMYLDYQQNHSFATSLVTQVQMTPGYKDGMRVNITGRFPIHRLPEGFSDLGPLTGADGISTISWSYPDFYRYYIGTQLNVNYWDIDPELLRDPEYLEMETYPNAGFVKIIDGQVVVKLPLGDAPKSPAMEEVFPD